MQPAVTSPASADPPHVPCTTLQSSAGAAHVSVCSMQQTPAAAQASALPTATCQHGPPPHLSTVAQPLADSSDNEHLANCLPSQQSEGQLLDGAASRTQLPQSTSGSLLDQGSTGSLPAQASTDDLPDQSAAASAPASAAVGGAVEPSTCQQPGGRDGSSADHGARRHWRRKPQNIDYEYLEQNGFFGYTIKVQSLHLTYAYLPLTWGFTCLHNPGG